METEGSLISYPALFISFIELFLSCSLQNNWQSQVKCFPGFCELFWQIIKSEGVGGGHRTPQFVDGWAEVWMVRVAHLQLASVVGAILRD